MDIFYCFGVYKFGESNVVRIFIFCMWIGYGFDVIEIVMVWINIGFNFMSDYWRNVFFVYFVLIFVVVLVLMFLILCYEYKLERVVYLIGYFKLIVIVIVCFIFF